MKGVRGSKNTSTKKLTPTGANAAPVSQVTSWRTKTTENAQNARIIVTPAHQRHNAPYVTTTTTF